MDHFILYKFYNEHSEPIYIGSTTNVPLRLGSHRITKNWWGEVSFIKLEHFEDKNNLLLAEIDAIKNEKPKYNIVFGNKKLSKPLGRPKGSKTNKNKVNKVLRALDSAPDKTLARSQIRRALGSNNVNQDAVNATIEYLLDNANVLELDGKQVRVLASKQFTAGRPRIDYTLLQC